jgi:hypothetical protein
MARANAVTAWPRRPLSITERSIAMKNTLLSRRTAATLAAVALLGTQIAA